MNQTPISLSEYQFEKHLHTVVVLYDSSSMLYTQLLHVYENHFLFQDVVFEIAKEFYFNLYYLHAIG